jgi:oligoribonuclease NrnB/cAMP/cGMP phosphodiesterase (DHH superfamily)
VKTLCIYHGNCADGFGAAWVVRKALGEQVEFFPGVYQQEPPDVTGWDVILVDFSYKRAVIEKMLELAASITIIDHHKTAIEDLREFTTLVDGRQINCIFDTSHSGAMLAWLHFFPGQEPPALIRHIEDRDLWKFDLEGPGPALTLGNLG